MNTTVAISREQCISMLRRVIREKIDFDGHPDDLVAWMTYSEQLYVNLPRLLHLLEEGIRETFEHSVKCDLELLIEYGLLVRASIVRVHQNGNLSAILDPIGEIHPSLIWDEGEKRPSRWILRTPPNKFFRKHQDVLGVHPIFQDWPKHALLLESYPTPSAHLPVGSGGLARHVVLTIYPSETEISHLQFARRTLK